MISQAHYILPLEQGKREKNVCINHALHTPNTPQTTLQVRQTKVCQCQTTLQVRASLEHFTEAITSRQHISGTPFLKSKPAALHFYYDIVVMRGSAFAKAELRLWLGSRVGKPTS